MSRFIELTQMSGLKILINVKNIDSVSVFKGGDWKSDRALSEVVMSSENTYLVTESIEAIKAIIDF